nr:tetratricopeptide repeat protein [Myxococcales bacterium]
EALALVEDDPGSAHIAMAVRLAHRAFKSRMLDPTELMDAGHRLEDQGRVELAAEYYAAVVKLEPGAARGWTNLGEARRKLGQYDAALEAFNRALLRDETYLWALAGKAESLRMLGRLDDAVEPFERALARSPDHVFAIVGLASVHTERGAFREALPLWERALRLRPESGYASDGLARCHEAMADAVTQRVSEGEARPPS